MPTDAALPLYDELCAIVEAEGAIPALVGIVAGRPTVGMTREDLAALLEGDVPKVNSANIGLAIHRGTHAATTVSGTMELCAAAGVRVFATGGLGGVHRGYGEVWDVSADLAAFLRYPVAVVTSGVKAILDVVSTREALETLGVPVAGFRTDRFPAFYLRESEAGVDARFDDVDDLAAFVDAELRRTGRGIVVANPIPEDDAIAPDEWERWLRRATAALGDVRGRAITPALLGRLVEVSAGRSLAANLALARDNARLAARLSATLPNGRSENRHEEAR